MVDEVRPSIVVGVHTGIGDEQLRELLLGLEEEGVPMILERSEEMNPLQLAHDASVESRLGVGVGISLDYVVITTERLVKDRPYIARFLNESPHRDRALGANAARLVKRIPLHPMNDSA